MSILKFKNIQASGRWATAQAFLTRGLEDSILQPLSTQYREGRCVARNVAAEILGGKKKSFRFSTLGRLAVIGRRTGVANVFGVTFSGFLAWWRWRTIYLFKLPLTEEEASSCSRLDAGSVFREGFRMRDYRNAFPRDTGCGWLEKSSAEKGATHAA